MDIFGKILSLGLLLVFVLVVANYPEKVIELLEWFIAVCVNIADHIGQSNTPSADDVR